MSKAIQSAPKAQRAETAQQITKIVQYLLEKQERDEMMRASFHDKGGLDAELDSIVSDIEKAIKRLTSLYSHFQLGNLDPFDDIQKRVFDAREASLTALVNASCARQELSAEHQQRTRVLDLQRSAVRLAVAHFAPLGRGQARIHAKVIMLEAGLPEPEESTITKWIKEFRDQ